MNFLYIIIFSIIPKKAMLGHGQVAATVLSIAFFSKIVAVFLWIVHFFPIKNVEKVYFYTIYLGCFYGIFFLNRWYFLNPIRYRKILKTYYSYNKWFLRILGFLYLSFSYASMILSMYFF